MSKRLIKIHFQNGLDLPVFIKEVFEIEHLTEIYDFEESDEPDFIVFGPYGNNIPPPGNYKRIGYFCENIEPDFSICDWAFGVPSETDINRNNYKRIQWHNLHPQTLVKPLDFDAGKILASKTKFCNFLYSHKVPYREAFFTQLSKYKKVDAPGRSMNNMDSIDKIYSGDIWQRKRQFLSEYKFTIAFENYVYPGYQTEKLYDAMQANSIPIYCGDKNIGKIFNTRSFVNTADYSHLNNSALVNSLEKYSQSDFKDIRPSYYKSPFSRIKRKLKAVGRDLKLDLQFKDFDFTKVIERVIELDSDDSKYIEVLEKPWFIDNKPPLNTSTRERWMEIFNSN